MLDAGGEGELEQGAARAGVVAVVSQRIGDRFRHDRSCGKMHDRVDVEALEQRLQAGRIPGIPDDELAMQDRAAKARREVVEHDDVLAGLAELAHDVAADITGAAGDENCLSLHLVSKVT